MAMEPKEIRKARAELREKELAPFRAAAAAGRQSREAREKAEAEKEGEGEKAKAGQRRGMRAGA